jgi:hypothetical protein
MILLGPVTQAAHGGQSSALFDLAVGFVVLGLTWVGFWRKQERTPQAVWIAIAISAICAIFIYSGLWTAFH